MLQENKYLQNLLEEIWYEVKDNGELWLKLNKYWYRFNKYFIGQIKDWIEKINEDEDLSKEIYNFFTFYFKWWDFGYFRKRYDNYTYRLDYEWEDTKLIWASQDCYFVKTDDETNKFTLELNDLFKEDIKLYFVKIEDKEKWNNEVELEKKWNVINVKVYNISLNQKSEDKTKTKWYLLEQIEEKLNEIGKNLWSKFLERYQKDLEKNFFAKFSEDYFIHKNLKEFLEKELMNYIWDKFGNAKTLEYNKILLKAEWEKLKLLEKVLENIKIDENNKEKLYELIDAYLVSKWIYKKIRIIEEIKNMKTENWKYAIDILKENEELNTLFKKYKGDLNTEVNKKQPTNEFWDKFRKYAEEFIDILSQIEELKKSVWLQKRMC